jgi:cold shock CspA family protein
MPSSKKTATTTTKSTPSFTPSFTPAPVVAETCAAVETCTTEGACAATETCTTVETCTAETCTATDLSTSGRVKWFNNKAGYGFITVLDCETNEERDMFVHHSEIRVDQTQYKYLVQGEYVEFVIGVINRENKIDVHATNVRGINGGKLMCETRNEVRTYRSTQEQPQQTSGRAPRQTQSQSQGQMQSQGQSQMQTQDQRRPQLAPADQTDWMVVPRRRADTAAPRARNQPKQRQPTIEI